MQRLKAIPFVTLTAIALVLGGSAAALAGTGTGEAFGVTAQAGDLVVVEKTPHAVLPPEGTKQGPIEDALLNFQVEGLIRSTTMYVSTEGRITGNNGTITSFSSTEDLDLLDGLVTADLAVAEASSGEHTDQGNQKSARISNGSANFSGLTVAGFPVENSPPPNTVITVPGVGVVILNEQTETGDNLTHSAITVNAIHVILFEETGDVDVIVSSAHSGVDYRR